MTLRLLGLSLLIVAVGVVIWSLMGASNTYYLNAAQGVVRPASAPEQEPSKQPHAPGFSEKQIQKSHGNGYAVY
jgi:hypothetical protein